VLIVNANTYLNILFISERNKAIHCKYKCNFQNIVFLNIENWSIKQWSSHKWGFTDINICCVIWILWKYTAECK